MPGVASFSDAFEQLNESRKKSALNTEEIREKILQYYLAHNEELRKIKKSLNNKKPDGSDWLEDEHKDDKETLKKYLETEYRAKLKEIYETLDLKAVSRRSNNNFPIELDGALGFFKPIISFMFILFSAGNGGLVGMISRFLHNKEVAKNPTIDLNEEEKSNSEYSYLFVSAAEDSKQYNAVYREITKTAENKEQVLNGLLRYVNNCLKSKKQAAEAKKRLEEVEAVLLGYRDFTGEAGKAYLCDVVNRNLDAVLRRMNINLEDPGNIEKVEKIQTVKDIFKKLVNKVAERQRQIEEDPLTKAKIEEFTVFINEHKRKLLHFVIKTQAFAKEETLKPSVDLKEKYKDLKSGNEYNSYFDYWLSKVPSKSAEALFVDHGSLDKMVFRQFMRKPEHVNALGPCEDLIDIKYYKAAQQKVQEDKLKEFREQVIASNVVAKEVSTQALKVQNQIDSLEKEKNDLKTLHRAARDPNEQRFIDQQITTIGQKSGALLATKVELNNQVNLLQQEIIHNTIDTTMVNLELDRFRAVVDGGPVNFNWNISQQIKDESLKPALQKALQVFDLDDAANANLKEMVESPINNKILDAIKLQTEYNPQTVSEIFSILQEQSNSLMQQTSRARTSLETPRGIANAELPGGAAAAQAARPSPLGI